MGELKNIKDSSPNPDLVRHLGILLDYAKEGKIRSYIVVSSWSDNSVDHCYYYDKRSYRRMMLAELMLAQQDLMVQIGLDDGDSALADEIRGD